MNWLTLPKQSGFIHTVLHFALSLCTQCVGGKRENGFSIRVRIGVYTDVQRVSLCLDVFLYLMRKLDLSILLVGGV